MKTRLDRHTGGSITLFQKHCQQTLSILVSVTSRIAGAPQAEQRKKQVTTQI